MLKNERYGELAQLGERMVRNHEVRGSIPLFSTTSRRAFWFAVFLYLKIRLHFIGCRSFVPQNLSGFAGGTLHLAVLFCRCSSFSEKSHVCCGYAFVNARMTPSRRYQLFSVTRRHSSLIAQSELWAIIAPAAQIFI